MTKVCFFFEMIDLLLSWLAVYIDQKLWIESFGLNIFLALCEVCVLKLKDIISTGKLNFFFIFLLHVYYLSRTIFIFFLEL